MGVTANNNQIINKSELTVGGNTGAEIFTVEQASRFIDMAQDDSSFLSRLRFEKKKATSGTIPKLGIQSRILRKKTEMTKSSDDVEAEFAEVPYQTVEATFSGPISEQFLRENIEGQSFEDHFMNKLNEQYRLDVLDLAFNGDESSTDVFLNINDGFLKLLDTGAHVVDGSTINGGNFSDDYFYAMRKALPRKHFNARKYVWIMSDAQELNLLRYLKARNTSAGDIALLGGKELNPLSLKREIIPNFPDDVMLLVNPENLTIISTYDYKLRTTREGKQAVQNDAVYYALHCNLDFIILEKDAVVKLVNIGNLE